MKRLHAEDVSGGEMVRKDSGVGDTQALEVVGDEGGCGVLKGKVEVYGVEVLGVEEVVALGGDDGLEVGAGGGDGDQSEVVVGVDLDMDLAALGQVRPRWGVREVAAQLA